MTPLMNEVKKRGIHAVEDEGQESNTDIIYQPAAADITAGASMRQEGGQEGVPGSVGAGVHMAEDRRWPIEMTGNNRL